MIKILVVDDDENKRQKVVDCINRCLLSSEVAVDESANVVDAAKRLENTTYDLLVLDVCIPMRPNSDPSPQNGEELLRQVQMRRRLLAPTHIIGLTAYADYLEKFEPVFAEFTWSVVFFDHSSDQWERKLANKLTHIEGNKSIEADSRYDFDLAIAVAIEEIELKAVLDLPGGWDRSSVPGDDTVYYKGTFKKDGRLLKVVAAAAVQMGMPAATGLAMKMCHHFRPAYLAMTGIAAGAKGGYGDILIADKTWDYGSGKSRASENTDGSAFGLAVFEPAPTAIPLDTSLVAKFQAFRRESEILRTIEAGWAGSRAPTNLSTFFGPIASGSAVLENAPLIDAIRSHDRKLVGVEMEAYGIFLAARICSAPRPKSFVVKSICDYGDLRKKDKWQEYAAYTSARYLYLFSLSELAR